MKSVYVLMMHTHKSATGPDGKEFITSEPYAVFEDAITAEKMKRDGDEIVKVPFFSDDVPNVLRVAEDDIKDTPWGTLDRPWVTWRNIDSWGKEGSTAEPPPYNAYPRVTCSNKTVDEHTWRDRVD